MGWPILVIYFLIMQLLITQNDIAKILLMFGVKH
jgi:hypothetical protein